MPSSDKGEEEILPEGIQRPKQRRKTPPRIDYMFDLFPSSSKNLRKLER